jgi:hypothetical protein
VVSTSRVRLVEGRLRIVGNEWVRTRLQVDVIGGSILPSEAGSYLVESGQGPRGDEVRLIVQAGSAEFQSDTGSLLVRAGEALVVRGSGTPELSPAPIASAEVEAFDRWVDAQVQARQAQPGGGQAAPYLPSELAAYSGTLSQYGEWNHEPSYGYVWYPPVTAEWQPYTYGRWDRAGRYGWFWIGVEPWAWPTHHYGRWGHRRGRWFWAPGVAWAPGWVHWAIGPGYVGWCALGQDNAPVVALGDGDGRIGDARGGRHAGHDQWLGWRMVPRDHFESRRAVPRALVDPRSLPRDVASAFVTQRVAPPSAGRPAYAVSRGSVPTGGAAAILRRGPSPAQVEPSAWGAAYGSADLPGRAPAAASPYERARPFMGRGAVGTDPQAGSTLSGAGRRPEAAPRRISDGTADAPERGAPGGGVGSPMTSPAGPRSHPAHQEDAGIAVPRVREPSSPGRGGRTATGETGGPPGRTEAGGATLFPGRWSGGGASGAPSGKAGGPPPPPAPAAPAARAPTDGAGRSRVPARPPR